MEDNIDLKKIAAENEIRSESETQRDDQKWTQDFETTGGGKVTATISVVPAF